MKNFGMCTLPEENSRLQLRHFRETVFSDGLNKSLWSDFVLCNVPGLFHAHTATNTKVVNVMDMLT